MINYLIAIWSKNVCGALGFFDRSKKGLDLGLHGRRKIDFMVFWGYMNSTCYLDHEKEKTEKRKGEKEGTTANMPQCLKSQYK